MRSGLVLLLLHPQCLAAAAAALPAQLALPDLAAAAATAAAAAHGRPLSGTHNVGCCGGTRSRHEGLVLGDAHGSRCDRLRWTLRAATVCGLADGAKLRVAAQRP